MSAATIRSLTTSAQTAIASGDWADAKSYAQQALALMGGMSTGEKGDLQLDWDNARSALNNLIDQANREIAAEAAATATAGNWGVQRIRPIRPTEC